MAHSYKVVNNLLRSHILDCNSMHPSYRKKAGKNAQIHHLHVHITYTLTRTFHLHIAMHINASQTFGRTLLYTSHHDSPSIVTYPAYCTEDSVCCVIQLAIVNKLKEASRQPTYDGYILYQNFPQPYPHERCQQMGTLLPTWSAVN